MRQIVGALGSPVRLAPGELFEGIVAPLLHVLAAQRARHGALERASTALSDALAAASNPAKAAHEPGWCRGGPGRKAARGASERKVVHRVGLICFCFFYRAGHARNE